MEDRDQPSMLLRYSAPLVFMAMASGAFVWFVFEAIGTAQQLFSAPDVIYLNKGVFYMLGVGIGLAVLSFVLVYEYWLGKILTTNLTVACTRICFAGVVVMFLLPHIVHSSIDYYLKNKGYEICHQVSHQWRRSRTIVYVVNMEICFELTHKEK
jgi:hypothetical protein